MRLLLSALLLGALPAGVLGSDIIKTTGFTTCLNDADITVQKSDVSFDKSTGTVTFDVAGISSKSQKVVVNLDVTAYGKNVYSNSFDPCDQNIELLCPGEQPQSLAYV
jgi:ML-like domain